MPTEKHIRLYIALIAAIFLCSGCATRTGELIKIDVSQQSLVFVSGRKTVKKYDVSTSKYGVGYSRNRTPLGNFTVASKYGDNLPISTNFSAREPTLRRTGILSRILWLAGLDDKNKNTYKRYIYIHGSPNPISGPRSIGCIEMCPPDVIDLFERVETGVKVEISL